MQGFALRFDISSSLLLTQKKGRPGVAVPCGNVLLARRRQEPPDQSLALAFMVLSKPDEAGGEENARKRGGKAKA